MGIGPKAFLLFPHPSSQIEANLAKNNNNWYQISNPNSFFSKFDRLLIDPIQNTTI